MIRETRKYLKDRKLSKYIRLGSENIKVYRPTTIVKLTKDAEIYGDGRFLNQLEFDKDTLAKYQDTALLLLKSKMKKQKYYIQEVLPKWFDSSRIKRLAGAVLWEEVYKEEGVQDEVSFMKQELGIEKNYPYDYLKQLFLNSKKPSIRIADLKRLIQIWVEENEY